MDVKLIGITGGSGSGKSTVVRRIKDEEPESLLVSQDNYYKSAPFISNDNITAYNFDRPDAFDMDLLLDNLSELKNGRACMMPQYDFVHHRRCDEFVRVEPKKLIIIDGIMIFQDHRIRDILDLKLYVDTPADIRFIRRLQPSYIHDRGPSLFS